MALLVRMPNDVLVGAQDPSSSSRRPSFGKPDEKENAMSSLYTRLRNIALVAGPVAFLVIEAAPRLTGGR